MKEFVKSLKENIGAILTAGVMLLVVLYYLLVLVPRQKEQQDNYNRDVLNELGNQLNIIFKDYANRLGVNHFKDTSTTALYSDNKEQNTIDKYSILRSINKDDASQITIHSVSISDVYIDSNWIKLKTKVIVSSGTDVNNKKPWEIIQRISPKEFKERLSGATQFPSWVIFTKEADSIPKTFLSHNLEFFEYDSLRISKIQANHYQYANTPLRFYKKSITLNGSNLHFIIAGAVSSKEFESKAYSLDVSDGVAGIVLVLLLFLCIPIIKPIISSKTERLTQFDLVNTVICIWLLCIILSSFIVSVYLRKIELGKIETELIQSNKYIRDRLKNCINNNLLYLSEFDSILFKTEAKKHNLIQKFTHLDSLFRKDSNFYQGSRFKVLFAIDSNGYMSKEIREDTNFTLTKQYKDRDYFKNIVSKNKDMSFSSVFSKSDNHFELITALRPKKRDLVLGIAFKPNVIYKDTLPSDFGFILINKEGRVLLHSDSSKNLNENLYNITHQPYEILKLLRGNVRTGFEIPYNSANHHFYATTFDYSPDSFCTSQLREIDLISQDSLKISPVFLLTFKKLDFENDLDLYAVVYALALTLGYLILMCICMVTYSIIYNFKHITIHSKSHIYWLFPDVSKKNEYTHLLWANGMATVILLLSILSHKEHLVYTIFVIGISAAFYNFIFLSQKRQSVSEFLKLSNPAYLGLLFTIASTVVITAVLYLLRFPSLCVPVCLLSHIAYIIWLRRKIRTVDSKTDTNEQFRKFGQYKPFLLSKLVLHTVVVPILLTIFLFDQELVKVDQYNTSSYFYRRNNSCRNDCLKNGAYVKDAFQWNGPLDRLQSLFKINPPSSELLKKLDFDTLMLGQESSPIITAMLIRQNWSKSVLLLLILGSFLFLVFQFIGFYTGRFFFFELSEWYTLLKKDKPLNLTNFSQISPPFSKREIEALYTEEGAIRQPFDELYGHMLNSGSSPNYKVIDLIIRDRIEENHQAYVDLWNSLSKEEKLVIFDFAGDYFVNYKNRDALATLIKKGLIITDPRTGRLRLMNYSFRKFILQHEKVDPLFSAEEIENKHKGTFAKWKLPLLIIAISVLMVFVFVFQESYNNVLLIGGSIFSTVTLFAKFLNNYKR